MQSRKLRIQWTRTETSRDMDEWSADVADGRRLELTRTRPSKYHGNGVSGLVVDMDAPPDWALTVYDTDNGYTLHHLRSGLSARQAQQDAVNHLLRVEQEHGKGNTPNAK